MELIKPMDDSSWDLKVGDIVVANYDWMYENKWMCKSVPTEWQYGERLQKLKDADLMFPVLIGAVCSYKGKTGKIRFIVLDHAQNVLNTDDCYFDKEINTRWFKYDVEKLGLNFDCVIHNLCTTVRLFETELKDIQFLLSSLVLKQSNILKTDKG